MSLLQSAAFVRRQLRLGLLQMNDGPSERIVKLFPPKEPPPDWEPASFPTVIVGEGPGDHDGSEDLSSQCKAPSSCSLPGITPEDSSLYPQVENYALLDYVDYALCNLLYKDDYIFSYSHSPPIRPSESLRQSRRSIAQGLSVQPRSDLTPPATVLDSRQNTMRSRESLFKGDDQARTESRREFTAGQTQIRSRMTVGSTQVPAGAEYQPRPSTVSQPLPRDHQSTQAFRDQRERDRVEREKREDELREANLKTAFIKKSVPSQPPKRNSLLVLERPAEGKTVVKKGTLSSLLTSKSTVSSNPFAKWQGRDGSQGPDPCRFKIYFPFSDASKEPLEIFVKHDTTVEGVIGFVLYRYVEEGRTPVLDKRQCELARWEMRIAEDDGTVEDAFPPLDRTVEFQKFKFEQLALIENDSRGPPASATGSPNGSVSPRSQHTRQHEASGFVHTESVASSLGSCASVYVRVHLYSTIDVRHTTTLHVSRTTLMGDVLGQVCRKRNVDRRDYFLKTPDLRQEIPLNTTLQDWDSALEFCLVKRSMGMSAGDVFIRPPDEEKQEVVGTKSTIVPSTSEIAMAYKKYVVSRRLPIFVGRLERVLAIDGEYIYMLPQGNRHLFDSTKTVSYHISDVRLCKHSQKVPNSFRLVVSKSEDSKDQKTYDFEAASVEEAEEICTRLQVLKSMTGR